MYRLKVPVYILSFMIVGSIILMLLGVRAEVDSKYDVLFESNSLMIVTYIYFISRKQIGSNWKVHWGAYLLIFNKLYDVVTEIAYLDALSDRYEFIDTVIEDGFAQVAILMIALGVTEITSKLHYQSTIDELTGLYNRKKLDAIKLVRFDLIYFDIDGLKAINDSEGHSAGDLVIVRFAQAIKQSLDNSEQAFRIGGDEFLVIVKRKRAQRFINALRSDLKTENIHYSYGVESTSIDEFYEALERTDRAMYEMKNSRRPDTESS
ncbi:GGDEF domain-containing protein [Vibrio paucivorans]|uniref:diguanylate cyclase n=1 Tax=Vibrio paucivorans TaxID=2829489 RepID=A0A9X3CGT0_9VIBR|nr:GGDEF domain-containing protein [Vibrio paucivorans]MCW8335573.1 GGDEF domain-containing protein [Vibrio paucivorans]